MALATGVITYRCLRSRPGFGRASFALGFAWAIAVFLQILSFALAGWAPQAISEVVFVHGSWILAFGVLLYLPLPGLARPTWRDAGGAHAH